jgi:hypothetical protein
MNKNPAVQLPINPTSLGQVSISFLKELFKRKIDPILFPIGEINLSSEEEDPTFVEWLKAAIDRAQLDHSRSNPIFKLWHLAGSLESFSEKQVLLSFYELDSPTKTELNIVKNNSKVYFSSNYTVDLYQKSYNCTNVNFLPLFFDSRTFSKSERQGGSDSVIRFGLFGKLEPMRKRHLKIIKAWIEKFGNNPKYSLDCAIYNNFLDPKIQSEILSQAINGKQIWNINFIPFLPKNKDFSQYLNNIDIALAMSGGEGWGLPEFHAAALGKHCVALNAHAYKDWTTSENSTLVEPSSKIPVYDNIFFREGLPFNQGRVFDWEEDEFLSACEASIAKFEKNKININGLKLQSAFNVSNFADAILNDIT